MLNNKILAIALLAALASPTAFAQATCAEATQLNVAGPTDINGDTTTGTADIDEVGAPLVGSKSLKYKFTAGDTVDGTLTLNGASWPWAIYVASNCQASSNLVTAVAHNDANPVLTLGGNGDTYTAGQTYYVIVASAPDGSADAAGPFTMHITPNLPVQLQNFSID